MKFILREAKNHRCKSPFHNKTVDILVVDGFIKKIAVSSPIQMKPKK
jgi:dihydroorotase